MLELGHSAIIVRIKVQQPKMPEGNKIDLSGDGGVLKEILKEGTGTETPHSGCTVSLHYTGRLVDGTEFDSSLSRNEPFEFSLGKGECVAGKFAKLLFNVLLATGHLQAM